MEILNIIIVKHGIGLKIAKEFNCSATYVCLALKGKRTKDIALKIRIKALSEYNGVEVPFYLSKRLKE